MMTSPCGLLLNYNSFVRSGPQLVTCRPTDLWTHLHANEQTLLWEKPCTQTNETCSALSPKRPCFIMAGRGGGDEKGNPSMSNNILSNLMSKNKKMCNRKSTKFNIQIIYSYSHKFRMSFKLKYLYQTWGN